MKNTFLLLLVTLFTLQIDAQNVIEKHFQSYAEMEDITEVYVAGKLFRMAANFIDEFEEDEHIGNVKDFVSSIEAFNLIAVPDLENAESVYNNGVSKIEGTHELLVLLRDDDANFSIFVDEYDGIVEELVGIGTDDNEFIVFSLLGQIDLDKVGDLISMINKHSKKESREMVDARTYDIDEMKIYPNPVGAGTTLNIDVPEALVGGQARFYAMDGNLIHNQRIDSERQQINTNELVAGQYIVELQKDAITMKKKVLVSQ